MRSVFVSVMLVSILFAGTATQTAYSVNFTRLAEGVYFCTMRTGGFAATERVVVLR